VYDAAGDVAVADNAVSKQEPSYVGLGDEPEAKT